MFNELWLVTAGLNPADKWQLAGMRKPETLAEVNALKNHQVAAIISLLDDDENHLLYQQAEMPFLWLPVTGGTAMTDEQAHKAHNYINAVLTDKPQGIVAVHCSNGNKRTGMLLAAMQILCGSPVGTALEIITEANPKSAAINKEQRIFLASLV